jgi:hypothetical protein
LMNGRGERRRCDQQRDENGGFHDKSLSTTLSP